MRQFERAFAQIHLDRIEENMKVMQAKLAPGTKMFGVVKADGYGHGAIPVAKTIDPYVFAYAVATAEEAFQLRRYGITKDILILGVAPFGSYKEIISQDISMTVFQTDKAKQISELALAMGKKAKVHIAVDTGMNRIGLVPNEKSADCVKEISQLQGIEICGMFTHFARADEVDKSYTEKQLQKFMKFREVLEERNVRVPIVHCSNSAGIMELQEAYMDAVRAGITIYGLYPSDEVDKDQMKIVPAMELKSFITYIKEIEAGSAVSYGGTFVAGKNMTVGTVGIGYADGYPRNASGKGHVLVCGKRVPILGRVCMDQLMIDLTDVPEAVEGTMVTLLGRDGEQEISMEELAGSCGGFHYEIPCVIGKRVPRLYMKNGNVVGTQTSETCEYEGF
ncbi:MAG: alanine racemase [Lachnospiraceae bacterium]|nr:alanine racemase [Lachnospiraceae bacterium]